jgi:NAD(P)-dependent dehydrogenase (short-subunit alcohol dehydrogenase family)
MTVALITGSAGLIGSEAAAHFAGLGLDVVGIDYRGKPVRDNIHRRWRRDRPR